MILSLILLLVLSLTGCGQAERPKLVIPESATILYDTTLPDVEYKYRSVAFSLAPIYEMNKKAYKQCMYDSLRTDLCLTFVYTGTEEDKQELMRRMAKDKKMFNTLVYWDGKKEFYTTNDIDREMHFIAYLVNGLNQIVKITNPTVCNFDSDSLEELYKRME